MSVKHEVLVPLQAWTKHTCQSYLNNNLLAHQQIHTYVTSAQFCCLLEDYNCIRGKTIGKSSPLQQTQQISVAYFAFNSYYAQNFHWQKWKFSTWIFTRNRHCQICCQHSFLYQVSQYLVLFLALPLQPPLPHHSWSDVNAWES